jgi:diaminopimelate decarboxylase
MGTGGGNLNLAFNLSLFPTNSEVNAKGHLAIAGCDLVQLAAEYGTPLYIFDEQSLRDKCREYRTIFNRHYPDTNVVYASKAYINKALARIFNEEGIGLDVVSGGEMSIAHSAGFPLEKVYFHGNNKSPEELKLTLQLRVGHIVSIIFMSLPSWINWRRNRVLSKIFYFG